MSFSARLLGAGAIVAIGLGVGHAGFTGLSAQTGAITASAGPLDAERMIGLLPEGMVASFDAQTFDAATGYTVLTNVRLTADDDTETGIEIGELVVAGFDADMLEARLLGTNLDAGGVLVDHVEARNVSLFGMERFYGAVGDAYVDAIEGVVSELGEDPILTSPGEVLEKIDFRIASILIDDFELRPYELVLQDATDADGDAPDEGFAALQTFAAFQRAIGAEGMQMEGLVFDVAMTADGQPLSFDMQMPSMRVENWHGGDIGLSVTDALSYNMSAPNDDQDDFPLERIEMAGTSGRQSVEGVRLDKVLGWLARGEMPPETETDLMSLGVWTAKDQVFTILGEPFYSVDSSTADMTGFHWLVPTDITMTLDNLVYDIGGLVTAMTEASPDVAEDPEVATLVEALAVMETYGLAAPSFDMDLKWAWDAEAGPGTLYMQYGLDGFGTMTTDLHGEIADFAALASHLGDDNRDEDAMEAFLNATSKFSGFSLTLDDAGGLDKLFAMVIDIAKLQPEGSDMAGIANFTPDTLRTLATSGVLLGASQVASDFPQVNDYAKAFTDYLNTGGTFKLAVQPETPISMKTMRKLPESFDNPAEFIDALGVSVEHIAVD